MPRPALHDDAAPVISERRIRIGYIEDHWRGDSRQARVVTDDGVVWLVQRDRLTRIPPAGDMESWPLITVDYLAVDYPMEPVVLLPSGAEISLDGCGYIRSLTVDNIPNL